MVENVLESGREKNRTDEIVENNPHINYRDDDDKPQAATEKSPVQHQNEIEQARGQQDSSSDGNGGEDQRDMSKLYQMCVRGSNFREDFDFEMYGEEVTAILKPLVDDLFLPLSARLSEHLDIDREELEDQEAVEEAQEKIDEARPEDGGPVDISKMDEEFINIMQTAAILGIAGEDMGHTDEEVQEMVSMMMGGYSVEIGGQVLEMSGDVRDATRFRGARGASQVLANWEHFGVPLVQGDQTQLIPFQRIVLSKEIERRNEEKERQMNNASSGRRNSFTSGGGAMGSMGSNKRTFVNNHGEKPEE